MRDNCAHDWKYPITKIPTSIENFYDTTNKYSYHGNIGVDMFKYNIKHHLSECQISNNLLLIGII